MTLSPKEVEILLRQHGAIIDGHFRLASGRHSAVYVNKDAAFAWPSLFTALCWQMARQSRHLAIEAVVGPAVGGAIIAQKVAEHLNKMGVQCPRWPAGEIIAAYADKTDDGGYVVKRGYDRLLKGKQILLVDDVMTTGDSCRKVAGAIYGKAGETIIGVSCFCLRGNVGTIGGRIPNALTRIEAEDWDADACPLCAEGRPISSEYGKGPPASTRP